MVEASPKRTAVRRSEIISLAFKEGHDADIPTNLGSLEDAGDSSKEVTGQVSNGQSAPKFADNKEYDVEKGDAALSRTSSTLSSTHAAPEEPEPEPEDPNKVWWDGPDDPANPMNWSPSKKWGSVALVSAITFITPLASTMFAPGVPYVMKEFDSNSDLLAGFIVSVYVLGFAFGPLVIAPLSEMYGRLPLYHICNVLFIVFNVGCAYSTSIGMLIAFRFLAGTVGAAPLTLGGGTIADLIPREKRGLGMSIWVMGPTAAPAVGPVAGGFLSQAEGWRWTFKVLAIASGFVTLLSFAVMKETYAPVLLERKAKRLQKETGNMQLRSKLATDVTFGALFKRSIIRPTKMLLFSPIVLSISAYVALIYSYLYILLTTFTPVFEQDYGFTPGTVGLSYLGIGIGAICGQFFCTWGGDYFYNKANAKTGTKPENRLFLMLPGAALMPVGLFWYGWSAQAKAPWIVPILGTGVMGFAIMLVFLPAITYLVDAFTIHAASAMAANTVLRSVCAALIPLAGEKMYGRLGYGWGNSLLGFVAIAFAPIPLLFLRYGESIRVNHPVKL